MKKIILPIGKVVSRGGAHFTICDGENHYDVILNPHNLNQVDEVARVNWGCEDCKEQ